MGYVFRRGSGLRFRHEGCVQGSRHPLFLAQDRPVMHAFYSAVLASLFAQNSACISQQGATVSFDTVAEYWLTSRSRIDLWEHAIVRLRRIECEREYRSLEDWWKRHRDLLEEVFVTETLTRTVAASARNLRISDREGTFGPVADSVFVLQHDLTNEIRRAMLRHQLGAAQPYFMRLNRIRIATQNFTDKMLGWMSIEEEHALHYAFCEENAVDFRDEMKAMPNRHFRNMMMQLSSHASKSTLRPLLSNECMLPQANREVLNSVIALMGRGIFDQRGILMNEPNLVGLMSMVDSDSKPPPPHFHWSAVSPTATAAKSSSTPGHHLSDRWYGC